MSRHTAAVDWIRDPATTDADYLAGHYSRVHAIGFDGGASLVGSASPAVVRAPWSDPAGVDPEELLTAAASTCHMLWFLDLARRAGVVVRRYQDAPEGEMGAVGDGAVGFRRIILRPRIEFGEPAPTADAIADLHTRAHAACYIANSLKAEVVVEPPVD